MDDPSSPPFYETNLFWGCFGTAVAAVLTVVGMYSRIGLAHWLLIGALPFAAVAIWCALSVVARTSWRIATTVVAAVVVAIILFQIDARGVHDPLAMTGTTIPTPNLYLGCTQVALPWPMPPGSTLHFAGLDVLQGINSMISPPTSKDSIYWPSIVHDGSAFVYRCDLVNDGTEPVFRVTFCLDGALADKAQSLRDVHGFAERLEAHGGKFEFYIWNSNPEVARVLLPLYVTLETSSKPEQQRVKIRLPAADSLVFIPAKVPSAKGAL